MMRFGLSVASVAAVLVLGQFGPYEPNAKQLELRQAVIEADSPQKAGQAFEKFFKSVAPQDTSWLSILKTDTNISIALQAAWHQKIVATPNWSKSSERGWFLTPNDAQRFFGFLEGRTGSTIPEWWQSESSFPDLRLLSDWEGEEFESLPKSCSPWEFRIESSITAEKVDDGIKLASDNSSIIIPGKLLTQLDDKDGLDQCKIYFIEGRAFVAFFSDFGDPGPLICLDVKSNKVLWTSEMWALGKMEGGASGGWATRLELQSSKHRSNEIVIWGAGNFGNYVEAFDVETGKADFRFSTNYWHAWNGE